MGNDLGTYHLRVELQNGQGWIEVWQTGRRYCGGNGHSAPLDAMAAPPPFNDERDLIAAMLYDQQEGNSSCDCNTRDALARATQQPEPEDSPCGSMLLRKRLTVIRPDGSEQIIYERKP